MAAAVGARTDIAIRATDVWKAHGGEDVQPPALRGIDLEVAAGRFTAVLGPSGSGKSTLVHCLAGLDPVCRGEVVLAGTALSGLSDAGLTRLRRTGVGVVLQRFDLLPALSVEENILLPLAIASRRPDWAWFHEVVRVTGLADRLAHRPDQLSGGQQRRVACARALITRPKVVFADEPIGNLDPSAGAEVLDVLRAAVEEFGRTVVMATQDPVAACRADRVVFLADGEIVGDVPEPTPHRLLDQMKLFEAARGARAGSRSRRLRTLGEQRSGPGGHPRQRPHGG